MITNNGNTTQVLKSVEKDTLAVCVDVFPDPCLAYNCTISFNNNNSAYNSWKFTVLTQQCRFYPTNESPLLYKYGGFSPLNELKWNHTTQ